MEERLAEWRPTIDEAIEAVIAREITEEYLIDSFGPPTYQYDTVSLQNALADPVWDLLDRGGKRWRAVLFLIFVEALDEEPDEYIPYATVPEILHNGTIIVDDVEDGAAKRRGEPALHHIYGKDVALNAGNALYFIPLKLLTHEPGRTDLDPEIRLRAVEMLMYELNRTHLGQGMDIQWHKDPRLTTSEADYLEMCACKTGCLGRIVARLAAIVTEQPPRVEHTLADYAESVSVAFQIGDDILDIEHSLGNAGAFGKAFGNDIREGKATLMVIHTFQTAPEEDALRLREILAAEENTDAEIEEALDLISATDAVEYARSVATDLAGEAASALDDLDLESEAETQLREFTRFVVERDR